MSQLQIKRQTIRNQIRKSYIQDYIKKCREELLLKHPQSSQLPDLTPEQFDVIYNQLQVNDYRSESLINFLKVINSRSTLSYNQPLIFQRMKYVLKHLDDEYEKEQAIQIVKNICERTLTEAIRHPSFMEKIFREVIELIGIHDFNLESLWPMIAMIRNQIFFTTSFDWFFTYLGTYPSDIGEIMDSLTLTFLNFTLQSKKEQLKHSQNIEIVDCLKKILHYYCLQLQQEDMQRIVLTMLNILKMYPFEVAIETVNIKDSLKYFLDYLEETVRRGQFINNRAVSSILELIGFISSGNSSKFNSTIFKSYPKLTQILCKLLPINAPFKKIQMPRPVQWTHHNIQLILGTMLCLGNIASWSESFFELVANGTFNFVVQLSAFSSSLVKEEAAIFLWNMLIGKPEEGVGLLCDNEAFYIICNALTAEHSGNAQLYSLKCLLVIIETAKSLKSNSSFWCFPLPVIHNILIKTDTFKEIERLCMSKNPIIAQKAVECIEHFD